MLNINTLDQEMKKEYKLRWKADFKHTIVILTFVYNIIPVTLNLGYNRHTIGYIVYLGDLRLSGSILRNSRFIFTKERGTIRQKSGCLNHSNERIFQVKGRIKDSWKGGSYVYKVLVSLCGFYLIYLKYSMKMK